MWGDLWAWIFHRISLAKANESPTQAICEPLWTIRKSKVGLPVEIVELSNSALCTTSSLRYDERSEIFHCKLKFRGHSPRNSHSGRAKLAAKVPKIRSFSKMIVHNFYGVINLSFEWFRGRKCRRLHKIGIFSGVVIGKCEFTTRKKMYIKKQLRWCVTN